LWGKISDLYGRRPMLQIAIGGFVISSMLAGVAQNMEQLILFRAAQGLFGGGLIAVPMATMGDMVAPRDRGRYQGYFAVLFGVSSVLGPVLGGFFADGPGWRWMFYINVPVGILALVITSVAMKLKHVRRDHKIDYLGAAVIVSAVFCLLLFTAWAGPEHGWGSPISLALVIGGFALSALFVLVELRATEPIIPMNLFRNSVFRVANSYAFLTGFAMFGSMVFLPIYLQLVDGMSPTNSGLAMIPLVFAMFGTSVIVGRLMSRTGRYRIFPILGSSIVLISLLLLARLDNTSPYWHAGVAMGVMGVGLGMTMQVMIIVVQNSVDHKDIGVATSAIAFFRQMGGSFGTALFGAILTSRLAVHLAEATEGAGGLPDISLAEAASNVEKVQALPEPLHSMVTGAFADSLQEVFLSATPVVLLALGIAWMLKEIPLGTKADATPAATQQEPAQES
jgi:EmrB/QacA subfamily drug resistance transporter